LRGNQSNNVVLEFGRVRSVAAGKAGDGRYCLAACDGKRWQRFDWSDKGGAAGKAGKVNWTALAFTSDGEPCQVRGDLSAFALSGDDLYRLFGSEQGEIREEYLRAVAARSPFFPAFKPRGDVVTLRSFESMGQVHVKGPVIETLGGAIVALGYLDQEHVLSVSAGGALRRWSLEPIDDHCRDLVLEEEWRLKGPLGPCAVAARKGRWLVVGAETGRFWYAVDGSVGRKCSAFWLAAPDWAARGVTRLALSPDGRFLVSATNEERGQVRLWELSIPEWRQEKAQ
jgi:hypothetical protein